MGGLRPRLEKALLRDPLFGLSLALPIAVWIVATVIYPLVQAVLLSLHQVGYVGTSGAFAGLANYRKLLALPLFHRSFLFTIAWTAANVVLQLLLAMACALVLNQDFVGKHFLRTWIILPWVFPSIVLATLGKWVLDPTLGVVNYALVHGGLLERPIPFLGSQRWAPFAVTALNVWRWFPFFAVVLLAALQTIPKELYEASNIDRATRWQQFRYIELPSIRPVVAVQILISSLWAVNLFDIIWLLTRGGPAYATTTLPILVYLKGFQEFRISEASAVAILMFVAMLIWSAVYIRKRVRIELEG